MIWNQLRPGQWCNSHRMQPSPKEEIWWYSNEQIPLNTFKLQLRSEDPIYSGFTALPKEVPLDLSCKAVRP